MTNLTIKQKLITCYKLLFTKNNTLTYIIDLEERCKLANFAPYDMRVQSENTFFVWDAETIRNAEDWFKLHKSNDTPN